MVPTIIQ